MASKRWSAQALFRMLGPGLVTGAADDDPSGIATYSQGGAQFGYSLGWTMFLTTPFMIAIQMVSARIGAVTGQGLAANLGKAMPTTPLYGIVGLLLMANMLNIAADIAAMADVIAGDGQVTLGAVVAKHDAIKIRRVGGGKVLTGFAGSAADAFALLERFEKKLAEHPDNTRRAVIEFRPAPGAVRPLSCRRDWDPARAPESAAGRGRRDRIARARRFRGSAR